MKSGTFTVWVTPERITMVVVTTTFLQAVPVEIRNYGWIGEHGGGGAVRLHCRAIIIMIIIVSRNLGISCPYKRRIASEAVGQSPLRFVSETLKWLRVGDL